MCTNAVMCTKYGYRQREIAEYLGVHYATEWSEKKFYKVCKLWRYMKMITSEDTLMSLQVMRHEITPPRGGP